MRETSVSPLISFACPTNDLAGAGVLASAMIAGEAVAIVIRVLRALYCDTGSPVELCFQSPRRVTWVVSGCHRCGYCNGADTRGHHFIDILLGNPRNRDRWDFVAQFRCNLFRVLDPRQDFSWLGGASKDRPDTDVVCTVENCLLRLIDAVGADAN